MLFCSCHLDLEPMTLIYDLDLDILKLYLRTMNELYMPRLSKIITDRHTLKTWKIYHVNRGALSGRITRVMEDIVMTCRLANTVNSIGFLK